MSTEDQLNSMHVCMYVNVAICISLSIAVCNSRDQQGKQ